MNPYRGRTRTRNPWTTAIVPPYTGTVGTGLVRPGHTYWCDACDDYAARCPHPIAHAPATNFVNLEEMFANRRAQYKYRNFVPKAASRAVQSARRQAGLRNRRFNQALAGIPMPVSSRGLARATSKETGYVDVATGSYACDTTGTITLLNTVAQGASVNQRIGKKYTMISLQCRGLLSANSTTKITEGVVLIVYDRRPTGSLPAITDILVTSTSTAFNNDNNAGRFKILKRWTQQIIGNNTTPATGKESFDADFFLKMNNIVVCKAAGTGAIGDIEEGALYLVTVGDQATGGNAAGLTAAFRLRFVDNI